MVNLKPKLKINKFTGSGDGLLYYNEGFVAGNENGNSLLTESFKYDKYWDTLDAGFEGDNNKYSILRSILPLSTIDGKSRYNIFIDWAGQLFIKGLNTYNGYLTDYLKTGTSSCDADFLELPSGNILVSSSITVGLIIRGRCETGSGTTKIIDTSGRNLGTLGAGGTYVQNLTTGAIYRINSLSMTTSTNDTLNFTAQTGFTNSEGDEFFVYVRDKFSVSETKNNVRQIKQTGLRFYILNGNKLARLDNDEETFDEDFKLLPPGYEALSFDVNSGKMLFSAKNDTGKSTLLLWDSVSDGWNNILDLDGVVYSVKSYKSGWVYVLRGVIYYTDGFSIQKLSAYSDNVKIGESNYSVLSPNTFNGITVFNDYIYFINSQHSPNYDGPRTEYGVYVFNPESGWSFLTGLLNGKQIANPQFISLSDNQIYVGFSADYTETDVNVGGVSIIKEGSYTDTNLNKSFITYIELPNEMPVIGIGLNLSFNNDISNSGFSTEKKTNITVSIGNGNQTLMKEYSGNIKSSSRIDISRFYDVINIGDELRFTGPNGLNNGKRYFVTNKQLQTGDDTILTVTPATLISETYGPSLKIIKVKKCGNKTITENQMNTEQLFFLPSAIYSNKLFIEVVVNGIANSMPISVTGINIY